MRLVKAPPRAVLATSMAPSVAASKAGARRPAVIDDCGPARSTIRTRGADCDGRAGAAALTGSGVEGARQVRKAFSSAGASSAWVVSPTTTRVALSGRNQVA